MPKLFSKESYEKATLGPRKLRAYIDLVRPFTLLAPLIGGVSGALLAIIAVEGWDAFDLLTLLHGAGTLMLVNAASNTINQVYDLEIDRVNKPYRPIPQGEVRVDEARTIAWILYLIALLRATLLSPWFGLFVCILIMITIFYSIPPLRLKNRLWVANISIAFARGCLGYVAAWSIFSSPIHPLPWVIGAVLAIYLVGAITTKDFTDMEGDRRFGARTLPVVYGLEHSIKLSAPFFIVPFLLIPISTYFGLITQDAVGISVLIGWGVYVIWLLSRVSDVEDTKFENSPVWKHMYGLLMTLQFLFLFVYLI